MGIGLEATTAVRMAQDLSRVENIVLIYLSEQNSDDGRFVEELAGVTGKVGSVGINIYVC